MPMDDRRQKRRFIALWLVAVGAALLLFGCEEPGPRQTGSIRVTSTPPGARIFLDQNDTGRVTPYTIPDASAGFHTIRLTLDDHSDWGPQSVSVTAGQTATVDAALEPTTPRPEPVDPEQRGLGLRRQSVEAYQSAYILRADPVIALPSSVDLSRDVPLPRSQGYQGSCVGWAVAFTLKSYHERIERGWPLTNDSHLMSPAYVYNQIKVPGGGAYFFDAFNLLLDQGVSSWAQMPYHPSDDRTQPSAAARAEAANYRIADWGTVMRTTHTVFVQEIKRHLASGEPVVIGVPVYPDFVDLSESNPVYDDDGGSYSGAHAIVIVGYDDTRSAFKIVNSWGADWGIGGYGWIDYDASKSLIWEAYVTGDVVASPDDERPEAASDPGPGTAATGVAVDTVLRWTRNARTTSFDVYLGIDRDLGAVDFQSNVAQATFAPDLAPASRYYWRVDARGVGGVTRGPVWSFTTAGTPELPRRAINPRPADGETAVAVDTVLSWDSGGHTTSYDVYFGTRLVLGAREFQGTQATRTLSPGRLLAGTRYYWRIDAKNGQGTTTGEVWSFATDVRENRVPTFGSATVANVEVEQNTPIPATQLPVATGGDGVLTYELFPTGTTSLTPLPTGLIFDASTRTLSGVLSELGLYLMTYRAVDADGDATRPLVFRIVVSPTNPPEPQPGITWRAVDTGMSGNLYGVAWSGRRFVAVGDTIVRSDDGITWQPVASGIDKILVGHDDVLRGVTWNGERFVAVGQNGIIAYSVDGITWSAAESGTTGHLLGVAWSGERFVAVGYTPSERGRSTMTTVHSGDGISWTVFSAGYSGWLDAVAWNGERFVAVGTRITYSDDGITWNVANYRILGNGLTWNGERFVAVGGGAPIDGTTLPSAEIVYSTDGITWTAAADSGASSYLNGVAWNGKRFVAVGAEIVHSTDGITWRVVDFGLSGWLNAVAWNGERFVAVGFQGTIVTSP